MQEGFFAFVSDVRNGIQLRLMHLFALPTAMTANGIAMGFVTQTPQISKQFIVFIHGDGRVSEAMESFFSASFLSAFGNCQQCDGLTESVVCKALIRHMQLCLAAIHHHDGGHFFLGKHQTAAASGEHFPHHANVIVSFGKTHGKASVVAGDKTTPIGNHHHPHRIAAAPMRIVINLNALRHLRQ